MLQVTFETMRDLARQANTSRIALEETVLDMHAALNGLLPGHWQGAGFQAFTRAYMVYIAAADSIHQILLQVEKTLMHCFAAYESMEQALDKQFLPSGASGPALTSTITFGLDGANRRDLGAAS